MPSTAKTKGKSAKKAGTKSASSKGSARSKKPATTKKSAAKKPTPKSTPKKTTKKKTTAKKAPVKKPVAKKPITKKTPAKKTSPKPVAKKVPAKKPAPKKTPSKKTTTKKPVAKKAPAKKVPVKKTASKPPPKPAPKKPAAPRFRTFFEHSNEGAAAAKKLAAAAGLTKLKDEGKRVAAEPAVKRLTRSPLAKKEREHYKEILLLKRAQLVGDVTGMETEALTGGGSGALSSLPQHMADAGSDTYDQSLNLDLAAGQRKLLIEIDDALARIANNTFGICEDLGIPISAERLENTPWARCSIEGALEREHREGLL